MFKVYKQPCKNCLLSPDSIVSPERRKGIIEDCSKKQSHFICHNSSHEGGNTCCKKFYDKLGHLSQMVRIAERLGAVEFVEQPEHKKLTPYKDQKI